MFELTRCGELTEGLRSQTDSSHSLNKKQNAVMEWESAMRKYPFRDSKEDVCCSMLYEEQGYQYNMTVLSSDLFEYRLNHLCIGWIQIQIL